MALCQTPAKAKWIWHQWFLLYSTVDTVKDLSKKVNMIWNKPKVWQSIKRHENKVFYIFQFQTTLWLTSFGEPQPVFFSVNTLRCLNSWLSFSLYQFWDNNSSVMARARIDHFIVVTLNFMLQVDIQLGEFFTALLAVVNIISIIEKIGRDLFCKKSVGEKRKLYIF